VTKVSLCVEQLNSLLVAAKSKEKPLAMFPRDAFDEYLKQLQQRIAQIRSLDDAKLIKDFIGSVVDSFALKYLLPFIYREY
jgi:hypothetical protein